MTCKNRLQGLTNVCAWEAKERLKDDSTYENKRIDSGAIKKNNNNQELPLGKKARLISRILAHACMINWFSTRVPRQFMWKEPHVTHKKLTQKWIVDISAKLSYS